MEAERNKQSIDLSSFGINANVDDIIFKDTVYNKRIKMIQNALDWAGASPKNNMIIHNVWKYPADPSYVVCFGKYGKEYYQLASQAKHSQADIEDKDRKNCNDMKPAVFKDGVIVDSFRARFNDIFSLLEDCGKQGMTDVVKALSILFFRNALLIDHTIVSGKYCYCPPQELIDFICSNITEYEGIPMEVYLHALDAIGFNEDVKYYTQGKLQKRNGIGRENNMKTYCYAAACVLGEENWSGFIYKLMKTFGVSPITNKMFADYFPEANVTYKERQRRPRKINSELITVVKFVDHY